MISSTILSFPVTHDAERHPFAGSPDLAQVLDEHARYVLRTVRYLGAHPDDVDDVSQEVFIVAARRFRTYRAGTNLRAWLYAICVRLMSNYRRTKRRRREDVHPSAGEATPAESASPEARIDVGRARQAILEALDGLDSRQREVFVLFELEDLEMAEVATIVGCPLKTAYARFYAARAHVVASVERRLGPRSGGRPEVT